MGTGWSPPGWGPPHPLPHIVPSPRLPGPVPPLECGSLSSFPTPLGVSMPLATSEKTQGLLESHAHKSSKIGAQAATTERVYLSWAYFGAGCLLRAQRNPAPAETLQKVSPCPRAGGDSLSGHSCRRGPEGGQGQGAEGEREAGGSAHWGLGRELAPQAGFQGPERTELSHAGLNSQHKLPSAWARRHTPLSKTGKAPSVGAEPSAHCPAPTASGKRRSFPGGTSRAEGPGEGTPGAQALLVQL